MRTLWFGIWCLALGVSTSPAELLLIDSFENSPSAPNNLDGWHDDWGETGGGKAGLLEYGLQTVTEIDPPKGGGVQTLRQWWSDDVRNRRLPNGDPDPSAWAPAHLSYSFNPPLEEGDIVEIEFHIFYDPNFNPGPENRVKEIIMQSNSETDDRIYINSYGDPSRGACVFLQLLPIYNEKFRFPNINGGNYYIPKGRWVHYRWQIKLSAMNGPSPNNGTIYGWVDGVQRWKYDNINTHKSGEISHFGLHGIINQGSQGPDQKRYWDLFKVSVTPKPNPANLISDSFESPNPNGWDSKWSVSGSITHQTISTPTPPGGGFQVYEQHWESVSPDYLRYSFGPPLEEGDVLEFEYYLKYHPNFDFNNTFLKSIIMRNNQSTKRNEFYINTKVKNGSMAAFFQHTSGQKYIYADNNFQMPKGQWVHFRWRLKVAGEDNGGPANGYLHGWIDGVQQWNENDIYTIKSGKYNELQLNTTFNDKVTGDTQKRWWDLFKIRMIDEGVPPQPATYSLTVVNGTDQTGAGPYLVGDIVNILADPAPVGQQFDKWTGSGAQFMTDVTLAITTLTMPPADTTITATYKPLSSGEQTDEPEDERLFKTILNFNEDDLMFIPCESEVKIHDRNGQLVKNLHCTVGAKGVEWDGKTSNGKQVSSGVYVLIEESKSNRKVVVIR